MSVAKKSVIVGMSGGVDSAVAAYLLKEQGYHVTGVFMKNWEDDDSDEYCSSRNDLVDVVSIGEILQIEIEVVNFAEEYKDKVFSYFLSEYQSGRTPNPDILCNSEIKFNCFLDYALSRGADRIATGHYAGLRERDGFFQLLRAEDGTKDQSYFLYRLNQQQLQRVIFPLAEYHKSTVRQIASSAGLAVAEKKDSTGICFIGERPFREFLQKYINTTKGEIIELDSQQVVGEHQGAAYYTIGQRKGLHIGGTKKNKSTVAGEAKNTTITNEVAEHLPWFVVGKNMAKNQLFVVQGHDHPALFNDKVSISNPHFIAYQPHPHWVYTGKPRYRSVDAEMVIDSLNMQQWQISFAEKQWALASGQSLVIYESRVCLGGGIIEIE